MFKSFRGNIKIKVEHNCLGKIIFIHIPKNAGTSVARSLGFENTTHAKSWEIQRDYGKRYLKDKFVFAIVRNPIDRFLSLYNYSRMEISDYHNNLEPENSIYGKHFDFEILKNSSLKECANLLKKGLLKHDANWNHWEPQYTWIYDKWKENILVDKVYNFENLKNFETDFLNRFGISLNIKKSNVSAKIKLNIIDEEVIDILKDYYKEDFELFNYNLP